MRKILIFLFILLAGCAQVKEKPSLRIEGKIAIAPFEVPTRPQDVISGYLIDPSIQIKKEILLELDNELMQKISKRENIQIIPKNFVEQCKEIIIYKEKYTSLNPVDKWVKIGKCIPADYILVPQLLLFKERIGGEWGVEEPAKVIIAFNLIDVNNKTLIKNYIFKEKQQPLLENMLTIKKFIKRGGKWVSAIELAKEGIEIGIKEIGL